MPLQMGQITFSPPMRGQNGQTPKLIGLQGEIHIGPVRLIAVCHLDQAVESGIRQSSQGGTDADQGEYLDLLKLNILVELQDQIDRVAELTSKAVLSGLVCVAVHTKDRMVESVGAFTTENKAQDWLMGLVLKDGEFGLDVLPADSAEAVDQANIASNDFGYHVGWASLNQP